MWVTWLGEMKWLLSSSMSEKRRKREKCTELWKERRWWGREANDRKLRLTLVWRKIHLLQLKKPKHFIKSVLGGLKGKYNVFEPHFTSVDFPHTIQLCYLILHFQNCHKNILHLSHFKNTQKTICVHNCHICNTCKA